MSLVTRCPGCSTTFRVQPAQLSQRGGKVRCGKCNAVFDGLAALVEGDEASTELGPSPQLALFDPARLAQEAMASASAEAAAAPPPQDAEALTDSLPVADDAAADATPDADAAPPEPAFLSEAPRRGRYNVAWGLLALVAFCSLFAQALIHNRTEAALLMPELRPVLEYACEHLGCEVRLPRKSELMGIESSDLQTDPQREQVIQLTAVLRNRAPFPQEYPALELTLTNENDRATVRRVLMPGEYLGAKHVGSILRGIDPGAEAVVRVDFTTTLEVRATGYRLYLFYP